MGSILEWTWPHEETFRFYLVQFFFWGGYFFVAGLIGSFPWRFTKHSQTAWTTFVLGAMGTLIAYLSQFLFKLQEPLDMVSPYAVVASIVATAILTPLVSLFTFVCRPSYEEYYPEDRRREQYYDRREESDYVDDRDERPVAVPQEYARQELRRRRPRR